MASACSVVACSVYDLESLNEPDASATAASGQGGFLGSPGATTGGGSAVVGASTSGSAGDNNGAAGVAAGSGGASANASSGAGAWGGGGSNGGAGGSGLASGSGGAADAGMPSGSSGSAGSGGAGGRAGAAGAGGAGGSAGASMDAGAPRLDVIDDLEDDNAAVRRVAQPLRDGVWDTSNDMSLGGMQTPQPSMFSPTALGADAPHSQDLYAAYTKGSGFTTYGAFMNVTMRSWPDYAKTPTYDASAYVGLSFSAKVGPSSVKSLRVRFISADTDARGGKCVTTGATDQLCYNHFYQDVPLTTSWALHEIRFADFIQTNTGKIFPAIDLAEMYGLEFYFLSGTSFELWIDDLAFIRK